MKAGDERAGDGRPTHAIVLPFRRRREQETAGLLNASPRQLFIKRAIDVIGSALVLLLLSPILVVAMAAIVATSPGPVIYAQERVGRGGRRFRMYKLRSMQRNAHYMKPEIVDLNECSGPVFKIRNDPRVTRVGRVLRRFSIDELPQLVNVLLGQMSLVGPRPPLPEEVAQYGPYERRRLLVTPGITCIAQVSGRSDVDFNRWMQLDMQYIDEWTLWLDIKVLARTVPAVLSRRGAY